MVWENRQVGANHKITRQIILWMRRAHERRHYNVTSASIGWAYTHKIPGFWGGGVYWTNHWIVSMKRKGNTVVRCLKASYVMLLGCSSNCRSGLYNGILIKIKGSAYRVIMINIFVSKIIVYSNSYCLPPSLSIIPESGSEKEAIP